METKEKTLSRKEIELLQTEKVFEAIIKAIKCGGVSYRTLIYDILGFDYNAYCPLIGGLAITNYINEAEILRENYRDQEKQIIEYKKNMEEYERIVNDYECELLSKENEMLAPSIEEFKTKINKLMKEKEDENENN